MNAKSFWTRRTFLSALGMLSGGMLAPAPLFSKTVPAPGPADGVNAGNMGDGHPIVPIRTGLGSTGNIYAELGVTPLVNINGTLTVIGGSVMAPEVIELIRQGNQHCVSIDDLEVAAGKFISKLCKSPAGYTGLVTCGAAAAILVSYAGMMTEDLEDRMKAIPNITGFPRTEVIIQKAHRNPFDHQIRQTGATLVEVETKQEMLNAINPKTLAIHFLHINENRGQVKGTEIVQIAKDHGIYAFNDSAADVPPIERLWTAPAEGWDFVCWSGGKDIKGPQATGLLIGKEKLVNYALLNMSPQEDRIGRPCKVGKEEVFGFLKALEMFVTQNFDETIAGYDASAAMISSKLQPFGVKQLPRQYDPQGLGNVTPHYSWQIDPSRTKITGQEVMTQLAATRPVAIGSLGAGANGERGRTPATPEPQVSEGVLEWSAKDNALRPQEQVDAENAAGQQGGARGGRGGARGRFQRNQNVFGFSMWQLKPGEDRIVADRLVEIFSQAPKA